MTTSGYLLKVTMYTTYLDTSSISPSVRPYICVPAPATTKPLAEFSKNTVHLPIKSAFRECPPRRHTSLRGLNKFLPLHFTFDDRF